MNDSRMKVSKLDRLLGTEEYPKKWYYSPLGHICGPFDTVEEMEADLAKYYIELPDTGKESEPSKGI